MKSLWMEERGMRRWLLSKHLQALMLSFSQFWFILILYSIKKNYLYDNLKIMKTVINLFVGFQRVIIKRALQIYKKNINLYLEFQQKLHETSKAIT